jgi:exonuclease VII small subunit
VGSRKKIFEGAKEQHTHGHQLKKQGQQRIQQAQG